MTAPALADPKPQPAPEPRPTRAEPDPSNPFPTRWPNAPWPSQAVFCPTCGAGVDSLLAACFATPACLTNDLNYDALFIRADDI